LSRVEDAEQYPVFQGGWYCYKGSSPAESHNNAMNDVRETPFVSSVIKAAENIKRRYDLRKKDAVDFQGALPPRVVASIADARDFAFGNIPNNYVTISDDKLTALVKSTSTAATHRVTFANIRNRRNLPGAPTGCDKGCGVHQIVCAHMVAACRKAGIELAAVMNPFDTTPGWRKQYEQSIELPCTAVSHLRAV
jgi:hypothetical protein